MENVKSVSHCTCVYNVETYLEEALMSLKNQTLKEIEFLIINDGSTDNSQKLLKKLHKMIHVFAFSMLKKWGNWKKPLTWVFQKQKGEYIAEFESDDYVALHAYERLYNTAKKSSCRCCPL